MLSKIKTLKGYAIQNVAGETIGTVREFYFDDKYWTIRYLVADTGTWLKGQQVLVSPHAMISVNSDQKNIVVNLTRKQIEGSPTLASDQPVSQQFEDSYYGYYGWAPYWGGEYSWGSSPKPERGRDTRGQFTKTTKLWDPRLRSTHAVTGYNIEATDGEIGHVEDFIMDDETMAIRYLVVATKNWWPGKKVLVAPEWIDRISWPQSTVYVTLSRAAIKGSPEFTEASLLTREYETGLYGHYDRRGYWVAEVVLN